MDTLHKGDNGDNNDDDDDDDNNDNDNNNNNNNINNRMPCSEKVCYNIAGTLMLITQHHLMIH